MPSGSSYLRECLLAGKFVLREPPSPCDIRLDTVVAVELIKRTLQKHYDYPRNVNDLLCDLRNECKDPSVFRHYLFPNVSHIEDESSPRALSDSVFKILLCVPPLQNQVADYLFERAIDFAVEGNCAPWIKIILQCFTTLDHIISPDKIAAKLIDLLDVTIEKLVRLEIISAIPDILGDREHNNIAHEMSRFLTEHEDLTPAILDCLSYLSLSDHHYQELKKKTMGILRTSVQYHYFPNFIKFLLMPGRMDEVGYSKTVDELRHALSWPAQLSEEICSSQVLTTLAIRNTITSSKLIAAAWLRSVSSCKLSSDHKAIDLVLLIILYSTSDERQKIVESLLRKHVKLNILKEEILDEAFHNFRPIFKHYLQSMMDLLNSILKLKSDNMLVAFASRCYIIMFTDLEESRQTITSVLLQHSISCKQSMPGALFILKNIADKDISMLQAHSSKMLALLDKLEDLTLNEIREIMNLLTGLAFSLPNSLIRDDMHMVIKKQLESSNPAIKIKGILAAIQAVKYLSRSGEVGDEDVERSEDINYSSYSHLAEGNTKEAAQIIELISRSTKQFADLFGFFYDELSEIMLSASYINPSFLSWLTDAVTNDFQHNFMVSSIPENKINKIDIYMQYSLNNEEELDCMIAINIAELTIKKSNDGNADISILPSLCRLVQILHSKKNNGDLGDIDALLGCAVIMPQVDLEQCAQDMELGQIFKILDCLIHCTNWFRELINGFATQKDAGLRQKITKRIHHIIDIESNMNRILNEINAPYKPPHSSVNILKYLCKNRETKVIHKGVQSKPTSNKKQKFDDTNLPTTAKSQISQTIPGNSTMKCKLSILDILPLRQLNINVITLLNCEVSFQGAQSDMLDLHSLTFILTSVNKAASAILVSKIKKNTHLTKQPVTIYNQKRAETTAEVIHNMFPKLIKHTEDTTRYISEIISKNTGDSEPYTPELIDLQVALECLLSTFSIYFKWIEFRNRNHSLLKSSLRFILYQSITLSSSKVTSLRDLIVSAAKTFQRLEEYCLLVPTAVALIDVVAAISEISQNETTCKILKNMAYTFLSKQWTSIEGVPEKGLVFNQYVDAVAKTYFISPELTSLKALSLEIKNEVNKLTGKNDRLGSIKSISRANFPILYKHMVGAVHDSAKYQLDKEMTDSQHLELWKDIAKILKTLAEIAKTLENRNNLSTYLKKSQSVFKLFMTHGMPIMEIKLKTESQMVIEIFKELQYSTKFLQTLCCHSRLQSDNSLMAKVPQVRLLLEQFIYKVKAALAANDCSEAFWMGNLKNKNLQGEVIVTQESVSEENTEDSDEQLPDDNDDSENDEDILNPDSKSVSDIH